MTCRGWEQIQGEEAEKTLEGQSGNTLHRGLSSPSGVGRCTFSRRQFRAGESDVDLRILRSRHRCRDSDRRVGHGGEELFSSRYR